MDNSDKILSYRQLIGEVRRLCTQRKTGCVFITTSDNHSVRFALHNGTIIAVGFRNQTGLEALASIQEIRKGRLNFSEELPPNEPQAGLPSTPELLGILQRAENDLFHKEEPNGDEPTGTPINEALARSRSVIEAELVESLGPMARVVLDEHMATATDLTDLIDSLAQELNDPAKSAQFKERVRARLAASVSGKIGR